MLAKFPNYDGARWGHVDYMMGARWVNAYVCETCSKLFEEYWSKRKEAGIRNWAPQPASGADGVEIAVLSISRTRLNFI